MGTARIGALGPYGLVRALAKAPAAWLVEATDATGAPAILQLARLRAATTPEERAERARCEAAIVAETEALRSEPELGIGAHGAVDRPDGTRVLYWALDARAHLREL
ncbi:hypothetical protein L6R52_43590, partial [Myxococcota bacterium]|nr:hypothetical protein [Myxococcota bacterium]